MRREIILEVYVSRQVRDNADITYSARAPYCMVENTVINLRGHGRIVCCVGRVVDRVRDILGTI